MTSTCPFCSPDPKLVFHEGKLVRAIWDAFPVSDGHALVLTKRHVANWFDATADEQAELMAATQIAREAIEREHKVDGYNIGINVGTAAGQTVPHLHVHVIPRREWDVPDPTGGVRGVIPDKGNYLEDRSDADEVHEASSDAQSAFDQRPAVVGGPEDPLLPHLVAHLDRAKQADLLVAFVLESGVTALEESLRGFLLRGGRLRLLTGDYFDVTDPRALLRLLDLVDFVRIHQSSELPGQVELRVFECKHSSFHPKAYIFQYTESPPPYGIDPDGIAYVGSSNLSKTALGDGVEWNYSLVVGKDRVGYQRVVRSFEELFQHPDTRELTSQWVSEYRSRRKSNAPTQTDGAGLPEEAPEPPPEPHEIQKEALEALDATRSDGNEAGLVVMATGLGKTWLAAFDVHRFGSKRTLFVAHREEILRQAQRTFRRILPEASLGLYTGGEKTPEADVIFASVQSLSLKRHLARFAPSAFDYIIIDEFHHASAKSYRRLIEHFKPAFLLGLTATPERTDGGNLLALCGENLVYRCDLFDAIRRSPDRLVPFHYFGVPDEVDYTNIPWRGRRFDTEELTKHVATTTRAENALDQWRKRGGSRTLGFCCSKDHADFMAEHFRDAGIRAASIHSGATSAPRTKSLDELADGELQVVFAVDILNEGVDIPNVDTVLMLRPTESRILFLQQLGRGLRAAPDKSHLTVIDYIGNHKSFRLKPETLLHLPPGDAPLLRALNALQKEQTGSFGLPPGCEVTYELEAIDLLRGQIRTPAAAELMESWYHEFKERTGERPLAVEAFHEGRNPRAVRSAHGSWLRFVAAQGDLDAHVVEFLDRQDLTSAFLSELERTAMTKSFKMITILAMLRADALPGSIDMDRLTELFAEIAQRSAQFKEEVPVELTDREELRLYLEQYPVAAWCRPKGPASNSRTYFELQGDRLSSTFGIDAEDRTEFRNLVRELAEWRLADYLGRKNELPESGIRIICKVIQTGGRPILKLPDRARFEGIPEGEVPIEANGEAYVARFVSQFVNVIHRDGDNANVLAELIRGWFRDDAGQPGTRFQVEFARDDDGWELFPSRPGDQGIRVDWATQTSLVLQVVRDDGTGVDASYQLEETDNRVSLIFHARGGAANTDAALNTQYAEGLELLLLRMARAGFILEDILLDTNQTRDQPIELRRLKLRGNRSYPIDLKQETDHVDLRRAISAAQGNNPTRRIRMNFTDPSHRSFEKTTFVLQNPTDSTS